MNDLSLVSFTLIGLQSFTLLCLFIHWDFLPGEPDREYVKSNLNYQLLFAIPNILLLTYIFLTK